MEDCCKGGNGRLLQNSNNFIRTELLSQKPEAKTWKEQQPKSQVRQVEEKHRINLQNHKLTE